MLFTAHPQGGFGGDGMLVVTLLVIAGNAKRSEAKQRAGETRGAGATSRTAPVVLATKHYRGRCWTKGKRKGVALRNLAGGGAHDMTGPGDHPSSPYLRSLSTGCPQSSASCAARLLLHPQPSRDPSRPQRAMYDERARKPMR